MLGRGRVRLGFGAAIALVACSCVPASSRGAVTIGSDLSATPSGFDMCFSGCTLRSNIPGKQVTSPIDGVIVRWRLKTKDGSPAGQLVKLRVIRPAGSPGQATGAGTSAPGAVSTSAATTTYPTQLIIHTGDFIGLDLPTSSAVGAVVSTSGATLDDWASPLLADGGPARSPSGSSPNLEGLWNADLEADTDGDGFGDETQDRCPGIAGTVNGCPAADLALGETASPNPSRAGTEFLYLVHIHNNGPAALPAGLATVVDTFAPGLSQGVISSPGTGVSCFAFGEAPATCKVPALAVGASTTLEYHARSHAEGGFPNSATVTYAGDPNLANNTVGFTATVLARPSISGLRLSRRLWREGSALPRYSRKPPIGTTISFTLSHAGSATLAFSRSTPGRRVGRRCSAPSRRNRRKPRCTRHVRAGRLTFNAHAGTNRVRFQGRLSRSKRLTPGRYTLTITATDAAGNRSSPKSTTFTIVR